jgi:hypothetical protein
MRIVVLTQDGVPIECVAVPTSLTRDYEHRDFAKKLEERRRKVLMFAHTTLHPTIEAKTVSNGDLPSLETYVLSLDDVNITDEELARVGR